MKFSTTLVLVILLAIGGGVIWFTANTPGSNSNANPDTPATETKQTPVFDPALVETDINRIQVAVADKPALVFERSPKEAGKDAWDDWRMTAPFDAATETWTVNGLLSTFGRLESTVHFDAGASGAISEADAGLDKPRATVTFTSKKDGKTYALQIGKQREFPTGTYVRAAGSKTTHMIERDFATELKREPKDYRAKTLTKFTAADVTKLTIEHDGRRFDLTKSANGDWIMNEPLKTRADLKKVTEILGKIATLRAADFLAENPEAAAAYGFDKPSARVTLTTETKKLKSTSAPTTQSAGPPPPPEYDITTRTIEFSVGNFADMKQTNRYFQLAGQNGVATVPKTAVDSLDVKLSELIDPQVTGLAKDRVSKLEIAASGQTATLEKKNGAWQGSGDLSTLDIDAVMVLTATLQDLRAIDFIEKPGSPTDYGLDQPRAVITATSEGALAPVTLRIGAETSSHRNAYAQVDGQALVAVVPASEADKLALPPLALRSRTIIDAKPEDIVKIERKRGDSVYALERAEGSWKLLTPADAALDPVAAQEMASDIARLRAKRVVARDNDAQYGLDKPHLTVKFTIHPTPASQPASAPTTPVAAPVERELRVAKRGNAAYCRMEGEPFVFELDESVYQVLAGELLKRELFAVTVDTVASIRVESPDGLLEFTRDGDNWNFAPDPFVKLQQDRVKTFVADVVKMRAEEYIAYQNAPAPNATPVKLTIKPTTGADIVLQIGPPPGDNKPRIAYMPALQRSLIIRAIDVDTLLHKLDYFLQSDTPAPAGAQPGGQPPMPGRPPMPPRGAPMPK